MALPDEIYSTILRYADSPYYQQINKNILTVSNTDVYHTSCQKPITENEIWQYGLYGHFIGKMTNYHTSDYGAQFSVDYTPDSSTIRKGSVNLFDLEISYSWSFSKMSILRFRKSTVNITGEKVMYYDMLTTYRILSKRLNCVKINPNYAKIYILKMLDDMIVNWSTPMLYMRLYGYLYINMKVMNLPYDGPSLNFSISEENHLFEASFMDQFIDYINYIPYMINALENYFQIM